MAIKFEIILEEDSEGMTARTSLQFEESGYTPHEADIARWLKESVSQLFQQKYAATAQSIYTATKENSNVH